MCIRDSVYTTESADEECSFLGSSICQMADGILDATSLKELSPLQNVKKPMVLIDRYFEGNTTIDCVMNRNYEALYQGTEYLIRHGPVSYTHLDVYKRQGQSRDPRRRSLDSGRS